MKRSILISVLLMILAASICQAGWTKVSKNSSNNDYCSVSFANEKVGYLTGFGFVKKTTNGGINCDYVYQGDERLYIRELFVLNPDTLWASGEGLVIRSFDGGATWDSLVVDSVAYRSTYSIKFSANGRGIAHDISKIFESDDFGNTWKKIPLPAIYITSFVKCGNDSIIVTTLESILRSTDNGKTWNVIEKEGVQMLFALKNGDLVALLSNGNVQKSTDWGETWIDLYKTNNPLSPICMNVLNDQTWLVSRLSGIQAYTTNGGESWVEPMNTGMFGYNSNPCWGGSETIYMAGANFGIFKSTNMGESWDCVSYSEQCSFNHVQFVDSLHAWSVGYKYIAHSWDGGLNWRVFYPFTDSTMAKLSFVSDSVGYASDDIGIIYQTTDCGANWKEYRIENEDEGFGAIHFFSKDTGLVASSYGRIYRTTDGCKTWKYVNENMTPHRLNSFFALDRKHVWAAGAVGRVLFSNDAGATWSILPTNTTDYYEAVQFVDPMHGWAVGEIGLVARTTDGGYSWTTDTIPSMPLLLNVDFVNKDTGWVAGAGGSIYVSINSGRTWYRQYSYTTDNILSLHINKDLTGMAYGYGNLILQYTPDSVLAPPDTIETSVHHGEETDLTVTTANSCNELIVSCAQGIISNLRIVGMLGNEPISSRIAETNPSGRLSVDISSLPSGFYIVRAKLDGKEFARKFVVSR